MEIAPDGDTSIIVLVKEQNGYNAVTYLILILKPWLHYNQKLNLLLLHSMATLPIGMGWKQLMDEMRYLCQAKEAISEAIGPKGGSRSYLLALKKGNKMPLVDVSSETMWYLKNIYWNH